MCNPLMGFSCASQLAHAVDNQQEAVRIPHALQMWSSMMDRGGKPKFVDEEEEHIEPKP